MGGVRTRECWRWKRFSIWSELGRVMKLSITIYQDEDGASIAECPSIPGCVSPGLWEADAEAKVMDAIRDCLAVRAELGLPPTDAKREIEVSI
jgi:predicted RNase H-like HicB family nuclease